MKSEKIDVLIPTYNRPNALAVTLTSLAAQTMSEFRVVISDQSERQDVSDAGVVKAIVRVLQVHGHAVEIFKHLPRKGMAEQRHFLLEQANAPYALFLDDDLILEPYVLQNMLETLQSEELGFVGCALTGLSHLNDIRPNEQAIEIWEGPVTAETVHPDSPEWNRHRLHNAANIYHVAQKLALSPEKPLKYRVAWVGGCVMYDTAKLRSVGGFRFWKELPKEHSGEDVLAQMRVMARYGGCGLIPSGVYHQELPTTVPNRQVDAPKVLELYPAGAETSPGIMRKNSAFDINSQAGARALSGNIATYPLHLDHLSNLQGQAVSELQTESRTGMVMYPVTPVRNKTSYQHYEIEAGVRKIAVLRCNAIGDFIISLPALEALRHAYPGAEIVLFGLDWHADFLNGRPGPIDRVEVIPRMEGLHLFPGQEVDPGEVKAFFERMKAEGFDLAIQLHGGGRHSNPFIKQLGARLTIGARTNDAAMLDRWIPYMFYQMEILRQLEIMSLVGVEPVILEPRLEVTSKDLEEANRLVPASVSPLVLIHPGAGDPRRRWPAENFGFVGDTLASAGVRVAIIGGEAEQDLAASVVRAMDNDAINVSGRTTLGGLAGLLARADLVISNDSGPLHMAAAVGTPTIGIYWVGNLITYGPVSRSHNRPAISWRLDCPVCGLDCTKNDCEHEESFVADVSKTVIIESAFELLDLNR